MSYRLTPVRMALLKKTKTKKKKTKNKKNPHKTASVGEDVEKLEALHTGGENVKWGSCHGK